MGTPFAGTPLLSLSLSLSCGYAGIASHNRSQKPHRTIVPDAPPKDGKQNRVVYAVKKLSDVAFQNEARTHAVLADLSCHALKNRNALMRAISDAAGKRCWDKYRFKDWIYGRKNSVMNDAVANAGLVDMPLFRIADVEAGIWAVCVGLIFQFAMKSENMFFQVPLKSHDIRPVSFIALKRIPCQKEIFRRYDAPK